MNDRETPVRPPRRGRNKSDPVLGSDEGGYDQLWKPRKNQKVEELHAYSLLGEKQQEVFDDVKESSSDRLVILNSSPLNDDQWVEDGRRFDSPGKLLAFAFLELISSLFHSVSFRPECTLCCIRHFCLTWMIVFAVSLAIVL